MAEMNNQRDVVPTPVQDSSSNSIPQKSKKDKSTTILLALLLGMLGVHRFYLGHYWRGALFLLFAITLIPILFVIIDIIMFLVMSDEKFDKKYNKPQTSIVKTCSGCQKKLTFMNTPLFGVGKLKDAGRVCTKCLNEIMKIDSNFLTHSKKEYDTALVQRILSEFHDSARIKKTKPKTFSYPMITSLRDYSVSLQAIIQKLQTDKAILSHISASAISTPVSEFIKHCVIYDLINIANVLNRGKISNNSLEATILFLIFNKITSNTEKHFLDQDVNDINKAHLRGVYREVAGQIISVGNMENPMQVSIDKKQDEEIISTTHLENNLSFPTMLKITNNPLFDDYTNILYEFALLIAPEDKSLLTDVRQKIFQPIPEEINDALSVSKSDEKESLDDVVNELYTLIGLENVKKEIDTLINFIKIQQARKQSGLKSSPISYHIVFTGNPGTGKTTVARIVAKIYKHLGILTEGHLIETDRSGLIAEYVGQTAVKVNKVVNSALNGVLFIDEAYALVGENKDDYGKEAVATLIKRMEDNRNQLVVILAGYTDKMSIFIDTNPGFKSRFNRYINFPDYTPDELFKIFEFQCQKQEYKLTESAKTKVRSIFENAYAWRDKSFGNGRFVRNVFEKTLEQQANRISMENNLSKDNLTIITEADIPNIV